jgi:hypothetical protein
MAFPNLPVVDYDRPSIRIYDTFKSPFILSPKRQPNTKSHNSIPRPRLVTNNLQTSESRELVSNINTELIPKYQQISPQKVQKSDEISYSGYSGRFQDSERSKPQPRGLSVAKSDPVLPRNRSEEEWKSSPRKSNRGIDDYNSPIGRTKYHSNMSYEQVSSIRQNQKAQLQAELLKQIEEKKQREAAIRRKHQEEELKEEQRFNQQQETYNPDERDTQPPDSNLPKPEPLPAFPTYGAIQPELYMQINPGSYRYSYQYPESLYTHRSEEKLSLFKDHAALRQKIELLKLESVRIDHDKERSLREVEYLSEHLKSQYSKIRSAPEGLSMAYIPVPIPSRDLSSVHNSLSFAAKSLLSSSRLEASSRKKLINISNPGEIPSESVFEFR